MTPIDSLKNFERGERASNTCCAESRPGTGAGRGLYLCLGPASALNEATAFDITPIVCRALGWPSVRTWRSFL
jgi:hypothetical protein